MQFPLYFSIFTITLNLQVLSATHLLLDADTRSPLVSLGELHYPSGAVTAVCFPTAMNSIFLLLLWLGGILLNILKRS